ncbi:hypothetical protein A2U01_0065857 [Trifolium medium]|uniref:Uncharacterized protein n=1 Tax=Trifolium medium TaxID=97028 RepID=A0A392S718_9FABA|nr:hypothetical protein [Trifolium medium]
MARQRGEAQRRLHVQKSVHLQETPVVVFRGWRIRYSGGGTVTEDTCKGCWG